MIMMVMSITVLILSVSVVVKANDHGHFHILSSLASNSSEDKSILDGYHIPKTFINGGRQIINKLEGIFKGRPSFEIPGRRRGSTSTNILEYRKEKKNDSDHVSVTYGFHLVQADKYHLMCDYVVAQTMNIGKYEVGLFAIFDGYQSAKIPAYLQSNLFNNIITQPTFLSDTTHAVREGYRITDTKILENPNFYNLYNRLAASTAITAILLKDRKGNKSNFKLVVANVGNSRAIICCKNSKAKQLSVDHDLKNENERKVITERGGYVTRGNFPRVRGMFPLSRAFGVKKFKKYVSCEPDVVVETIDDKTEFLVLVSHPVQYKGMIHEIMSNQELVNFIRDIKNPHEAAEHLIQQAIARGVQIYSDPLPDLSCIVVRFQ